MSTGNKREHEPDTGHNHTASKRMRATDRRVLPNDQYTVGWICALPLEMAAAKGMLDAVHSNPTDQDPSDDNAYLLGEVCGHNVAVACLPAGKYGTVTAANAAGDMVRTFKSIRFGLMVGIGGGIPSKYHDIRLGDIVVAQPTANNGGVIQFDRGKSLQGEGFQRTGTLNSPPQVLLTALSRLQAEHLTEDSRIPEFLADLPEKMKERFCRPPACTGHLYMANYQHDNSEPNCHRCDSDAVVPRIKRTDLGPAIHYGTIASGNQVIKDATLRDQLGKELGALCFEMEAAGLQNFPSIVIRGICDYADSHKNKIWQPYAATVAAAFGKELLSFISPSRVLQSDPIPQLVSIATESLDVSKQHLDISSETLGEHRRTNKILGDRPIDLHIVHEACYDSEDVGSSPRCEANTRVRIQQSIKQWADDETGEPFLWLVGPAGTGKSTLIRSVADSFHEDERLVAGYFFKRGEQGRNDTNRLFSTLAIQLANAIPSFKESLRVSVGYTDKDTIDKKDLGFQFEKLIKKPLQYRPPSNTTEASRIIVLDALDECERLENLPRVLAFFSEICNKSTGLGLRVILTSRPDPRIISGFEPLIQGGVTRRLQLHRVFSEDTKDDIRLYLKTNFTRVKTKANIQQDPWPSIAELDHLVELSTHPEPLFIYAATLLRFVYDENRLQNPKNQLKIWIKQCEDNKSQLHQMYNPILEQIFALGKDTDFDQQLQFLGALVLTALPLSLVSLTSLLALDIDDVNWWLPSLHAVLDIPSDSHKPLRLHHKSFSDFLLSEENPGHDRFKLNAKHIHALLGYRCVGLMEKKLKRDICCLKKLNATFQDINKDLLGHCIPFELQYSCQYWAYHLRAGEDIDFNQILAFFLDHLLHWFEVSALLRQTSVALTSLQALYDLVKNSSEASSEFIEFLKDAIRTVSSFASIIETAPLQTYASLLLYSPLKSRVRQRLWDQRLPSLSHIEGVKHEWGANMQTIEVPANVKELAFSPDGRFLASADSVVRLWNASTGTHLISFGDPEFHPVDISFSPSSQLLAASGSESVIKTWDIATLTHLHSIELTYFPITFTISSDNTVLILADGFDEGDLRYMKSDSRLGTRIAKRSIAISSDHEVSISAQGWSEFQIWGLSSRSLLLPSKDIHVRPSKGYPRRSTHYHSIAISSDLPLIALGVKQDVILIRQMVTTSDKYILQTGGRPVDSLTFSPNGKALAGVCRGAVFLWDTATHKRITIIGESGNFDGGIFNLYKVTFSSDSQFLVSHSGRRTRFWNIATGAYRDLVLGHQNAIAFNPDRQILATASDGPTIKLWDFAHAELQHDGTPFRRNLSIPQSFLFSPNDRLVVSDLGSHTLQIFDSFTGELLKSHVDAIGTSNFQQSHDRELHAFGSPDDYESPWEVREGTKRPILEHLTRAMRCHTTYSAAGQLAAALYSDTPNTVELYDTTTGSHTYALDLAAQFKEMAFSPKDQFYDATDHPIMLDHTTRIETMAFSPDGHILALSLEDGTIPLWDTKSRKFQRVIRQFSKKSRCMLFFSPNGEILTVMSDVIVWWDVATGICLNTIHPGNGPFYSSIFSPYLGFLGPDVLEDDEPREAPTSNQEKDTLFRSSAFSPNLSFIGAVHGKIGDSREIFTLYPIKSAQRRQTLSGHLGHAIQIIFSTDSQMVAVASDDHTIRLWHTTTYKHLHTFKTSIDLPKLTRFSQDGSIIAAASKHRTIRLWNTSTGSLLQVIHQNEGLIQELKLSPVEVIVSVSGVASDESWNTQTFKLANYCHPLPAACRSSVPEPSSSEVSLDLDECWVTENGENIILIPPGYRPVKPETQRTGGERWIRRRHVLFMACSNGQVISFRLSQ